METKFDVFQYIEKCLYQVQRYGGNGIRTHGTTNCTYWDRLILTNFPPSEPCMRFSTHTARAAQHELIRLFTYLKKAINQTDNCAA